MSQIVNLQQRRVAFFKFLALFLITSTLIIMAVYPNYSMPKQLIEVLQREANDQHAKTLLTERFIVNMDSARIYLDLLGKSDINVQQVEYVLNKRLKELDTSQHGDSTEVGQITAEIVKTYADLREARLTIAELSAELRKRFDLESKLQSCETRLATIQGQLDVFRALPVK